MLDGVQRGMLALIHGEASRCDPGAPLRRPATSRLLLPKQRRSDIFELEIGGHEIRVQVSLYPDGSPGEVWVDIFKEGSAMAQFASGFGIAASLLLQHGASVESVAHSLAKTSGGPSGKVVGHDRITSARSMVDLVAQVLRVEYGRKL